MSTFSKPMKSQWEVHFTCNQKWVLFFPHKITILILTLMCDAMLYFWITARKTYFSLNLVISTATNRSLFCKICFKTLFPQFVQCSEVLKVIEIAFINVLVIFHPLSLLICHITICTHIQKSNSFWPVDLRLKLTCWVLLFNKTCLYFLLPLFLSCTIIPFFLIIFFLPLILLCVLLPFMCPSISIFPFSSSLLSFPRCVLLYPTFLSLFVFSSFCR